MTVKIRMPYEEVHGRVLDCSCDEAVTKQEFAKECDINNIMARYSRSGHLEEAVDAGLYGDFSEVGTFLEAQLLVKHASEQFDTLPAKVRERFKNDVAGFLQFVSSAKREELDELGLVKKVVVPEGEVITETLKTIAKNTAPVAPEAKK